MHKQHISTLKTGSCRLLILLAGLWMTSSSVHAKSAECVVDNGQCLAVTSRFPVGDLLNQAPIASQSFILAYRSDSQQNDQFLMFQHGRDFGLKVGVISGTGPDMLVTTLDAALTTLDRYCMLSVRHPRTGTWHLTSRFKFDGYDNFQLQSVSADAPVELTMLSSKPLLNDQFRSVAFASSSLSVQLKYRDDGLGTSGKNPFIDFMNACRTAL